MSTAREVVYQCANFSEDRITSRYVRYLGGGWFRVFEVGADNRTLMEYDTDGGLPAEVRAAAIMVQAFWPSQVAWPRVPGVDPRGNPTL